MNARDVAEGVKQNEGTIIGCLQAARRANEIVAGTYRLILEWTIRADGSVTGARLVGPSDVMKTSMPGCFAEAMRGWSFPASRNVESVKSFPFGPVTLY